jgi:hypothetical protein
VPKPKSLPSEVLEGPATVDPVDGRFLAGVPHVPTVTDDATAARMVATGAFAYEAPELPAPDPDTGVTDAPLIEVIPLSEEARAALGFYAPEV